MNDEYDVNDSHGDGDRIDGVDRFGVDPAAVRARRLRDEELAGSGSPGVYEPSGDHVEDVRQQENLPLGPPRPWSTRVSQPQPVRKRRRRGPLLAILALLTGGGAAFGAWAVLAGALIHVKEVVVQKFDSMSSVMESREDLLLKDKIFGTSASCVIKVRCRYNGLSTRQLDRLEATGAALEGKKQNPLTRKWSGHRIVLADGTAVDAKNYHSELLRNPQLRDLTRQVNRPRFLSWGDDISKKIRAKKKLTTNPDWSGQDETDTRKKIHAAVSGESYSVTTQQTTNTPADPGTDESGNPKPLPADQQLVGLGGVSADVMDEAADLETAASAGEPVPELPSDPVEAANLPVVDGESGGLKKAIKNLAGTLNPIDVVTNLCTAYQMTNLVVVSARTIGKLSAMRYAAQFLSLADKMKAGDATPEEVDNAMTILSRTNSKGESFGDSFGYDYVMYGNVSSRPPAVTSEGSDVVRLISSAVSYINDVIPGGRATVHGTCAVATNPLAIGALSLVSFIPGAGALVKAVTKVASKVATSAGESIVKRAIKKGVEAAVNKYGTPELRKEALAKARSALWKVAKGPGAIFLASYMVERYGIPALARAISGTELTGDEDGAKAMDAIASGLDATNSMTAQSRGLEPLSRDEYATFAAANHASQDTYVADMRQRANPLDLHNPYSAATSVAAAIAPSLDAARTSAAGLAMLPLSLLHSSVRSLISTAHAASLTDELDYCGDKFLDEQNLATSPFCNVKYGFGDVTMLNNTDPTQVVDYMVGTHNIDPDTGNPVPGSRYDDFLNQCIVASEDRIISNLVEKDQQIPQTCYNTDDKTLERKMFRLYYIDVGADAAMAT